MFIFILVFSFYVQKRTVAQSDDSTFEKLQTPQDEIGVFSGRISRFNREIKTIKFKVSFSNLKYLNQKDQVEFWDEKNTEHKCLGYVLGRSSDYLLVQIPKLEFCEKHLYITAGAYFKFYSKDLVNNVAMGKDVVQILLKKRLVVEAKIEKNSQFLSTFADKMRATNDAYEVKRQKLMAEWKEALSLLEEDKIIQSRLTKDLERQRDEIDKKLELYKVHDQNLAIDRWSLDSRLYIKK